MCCRYVDVNNSGESESSGNYACVCLCVCVCVLVFISGREMALVYIRDQ